ncbi:PIR protein [Plasmodium vivax]|nr:PIR protein [Plasmodium vivax]
MADNIISKAFSLLTKDETFSKTRNAYMFYYLIDTKYGSRPTVTVCDKIGGKEFTKYCDAFEKILNDWDEVISIFNFDHKKSCHHLMYWIYGSIVESKVDLAYDTKALKNKKAFYDFLEYYNRISEILDGDIRIEDSKVYCDYIEYLLNLYNVMVKENSQKLYCEEILAFDKKFSDDKNLTFIKSKCKNISINLSFNQNNEKLCSIKEEPTKKSQPKEAAKSATNENVLKDVEFHELYEEFNKENDMEKYKDHCNGITTLNGTYKGLSNLCMKLARNLTNVSKLENKEKRSTGCSYFVYWVYEELNKLNSIKSNYSYTNPAIKEPYKVVNRINMKEFKDKGKCCTYFSNGEYSNECPEFFKCNDKYNPYELYVSLSCNSDETRKNFIKVEKPEFIDYYAKDITKKSKEQSLLNRSSVTHSETPMIADDTPIFDLFYTFVLAAFGLLGASLFFFVFYKFTPLGSRMQGNRRHVRINHYEEFEQEMLDQRLRSRNVNPQNRRARIAYQPG